MRPPSNTWPDTPIAKSVLFVAQLMRELLNPEAFESFRAMSLDTVSRLNEALRIIHDIQAERLPKRAFEPILAELIWSLRKDPILDRLAKEETDEFLNSAKNISENLTALSGFISLLKRKILASYKGAIEEHILSLLSEQNRRVDLRHAVGFYCSHMVNLGHSKPFLLKHVEDAFFNREPTRVTTATLRSFFQRFRGGNNKYIVYTAISPQLHSYMKHLGFSSHVGLSTFPEHVRKDCGTNLAFTERGHFLAHTREALDPDRAAEDSQAILDTVQALSFLSPKEMGFTWEQEMYVSKFRSTKGAFSACGPVSIAPNGGKPPSGSARAIRNMRNANKIFQQFKPHSMTRLMGALNTSALAHSSPRPENQLTSLWSAFEVLLSEPKPGSPRIVHYVELLAPCVCLQYARRQFVAVFDELAISYKHRFRKILAAEPNFVKKDPHTRFAAIILCENNENLRNELLRICNENPLALHRLWKLKRDFGTAKNLQQSLNNHFDRVNWQIHRIYRTRNHVVHSGRRPRYIDGLILNSLEYFRSTIGTIISRASREIDKSDLDQIIQEIGIEYKIHNRYISQLRDSNINDDAVLRLIGP